MEEKIIENVRTCMKIENMDIRGYSENIIKDFLNDNITEDEAVNYIKQDILSRRNFNV